MAGKTAAYIGKKAFAKAPGVPARGGGERGNRRIEMNCGDPVDPMVAPTSDPSDRAHGVMAICPDGITRIVSAAEQVQRPGPMTGPPFSRPRRNLPARPRRYHQSNMPGVRVDVEVTVDARGVRARRVVRVIGPVGLDTQVEDLDQRATWLEHFCDIDLVRGGSRSSSSPGEVIRREVRLRDVLEKTRVFDARPVEDGGAREPMHELRVARFLARRGRPPNSPAPVWRSADPNAPEPKRICAVRNAPAAAPGPVSGSLGAASVKATARPAAKLGLYGGAE